MRTEGQKNNIEFNYFVALDIGLNETNEALINNAIINKQAIWSKGASKNASSLSVLLPDIRSIMLDTTKRETEKADFEKLMISKAREISQIYINRGGITAQNVGKIIQDICLQYPLANQVNTSILEYAIEKQASDSGFTVGSGSALYKSLMMFVSLDNKIAQVYANEKLIKAINSDSNDCSVFGLLHGELKNKNRDVASDIKSSVSMIKMKLGKFGSGSSAYGAAYTICCDLLGTPITNCFSSDEIVERYNQWQIFKKVSIYNAITNKVNVTKDDYSKAIASRLTIPADIFKDFVKEWAAINDVGIDNGGKKLVFENCPKCKIIIQDKIAVCPECGCKITWKCINCGTQNNGHDNHCITCHLSESQALEIQSIIGACQVLIKTRGTKWQDIDEKLKKAKLILPSHKGYEDIENEINKKRDIEGNKLRTNNIKKLNDLHDKVQDNIETYSADQLEAEMRPLIEAINDNGNLTVQKINKLYAQKKYDAIEKILEEQKKSVISKKYSKKKVLQILDEFKSYVEKDHDIRELDKFIRRRIRKNELAQRIIISITSVIITVLSVLSFFIITFIIPASKVNVQYNVGANSEATVSGLKNVTDENVVISSVIKENSFVSGFTVVAIGASAFINNTSIKTVALPYTINYIGSNSFANCTSLAVVAVNSATPPQLGENIFTGTNLTILVPAESYALYANNAQWKEYSEFIFPNYGTSADKVSVVFNTMGGSAIEDLREININSYYTSTVSATVKVGYVFRGWGTSTDSGITIVPFSFETNRLTKNLKLYAIWAAADYKITFNYQGATGGENDVLKDVSFDLNIGNLPTPERIGYNFMGWYTATDYGVLYTSDTIYKNASDITLYARWYGKDYEITLDYQGATAGFEKEKVEVRSGVAIGGLPTNPTRTGFTFVGWNLSASSADRTFTNETEFGEARNIALYAMWQTKITLVYQGATNASEMPQNVNVLYNSAITGFPSNELPLAPLKSGNAFMGWFTSADGTGDCIDNGDVYLKNGGITLYAKWQTGISLEYQNATSGNSIPAVPVIYNARIDAALSNGFLPIPTKQGNTFLGWFTTAGIGGTQYTESTIYALSEGTTLYARWQTQLFFEYEGATSGFSTSDINVTYNGSIPSLPQPAKSGNTFGGWCTAVGGGGTQYQVDDLYTLDTPITLYAKWNTTINFVYYNATNNASVLNMSITYQTRATSLPSPTKTDNLFRGWWTQNTGGTEFTVDTDYMFDSGITLYAKWETTIVFDYQNASGGNSMSSKVVYYNAEIGELPEPIRTSHSFVGWYTEPNGRGIQYSAAGVYAVNTSITLYAKWITAIVFDYQGATGNYVTIQKEVLEGTVIGELPVPTRSGCSFAGWWTQEGGVGTEFDAATIFGSQGTITLYAKWIATISLDYQGGVESIASISAVYNAEIIGLPIPTKAGNTFKGWWTQIGGTGTYYDAGTTFSEVSSVTLYAKWEVVITFAYYGADGGNYYATKAIVFNSLVGELPNPTKAGYIFAGWFTEQNGIIQILSTSRYTEIAGTTLHAKWTAALNFDYQGATGNALLASKQVSDGVVVGELPVPTKAGSVFRGWWTLEGGAGLEYTANTVYVATGTMTVYAKWEAIISLNYQGADGGILANNDLVTYYNTFVIGLPTPSKTGNTFSGWWTAVGGGGTQYTSATIFLGSSNITLFAKWTTKIIFEYNDADGANSTQNKVVTYNSMLGTLPSPSKSGNTFLGWYSTVDGNTEFSASTVYLESKGITLHARWITAVVFDYQDATGGDNTSYIKVVYNSPMGLLPEPTKDDYIFDGWWTDECGNGTRYVETTRFMGNTSIFVYAKWKKNIALNYQGADGENTTITLESIYKKQIGSLPSPTKTGGNTFGGWWTSIGGQGVQIFASMENISSETLYAKWTTRINFEYENATGNNTTGHIDVVYNNQISTLPTPDKAGDNTFRGWFDGVGGSGNQYIANSVYINSGETTVYAKWETTITFVYNGATGGHETSQITVVYNSIINNIPSPTKTGNSDGDGNWLESISSQSFINGMTYLYNDKITLQKQWARNSYTITVNGGGGKVKTNGSFEDTVTITALYGDPIHSPEWLFNGKMLNKYGINTAGGTEFSFSTTIAMPADNITIVADWRLHKFDSDIQIYGTGISGDPFKIYTAEQLAYLATYVNSGKNALSLYFALQNSIAIATTLPTSGSNWIPIGNNGGQLYNVTGAAATNYQFRGLFDGGNFTISNFRVETSGEDTYGGLFGVIGQQGIVKNLIVTNFYITSTASRSTTASKGGTHHGAIAGINSGTIENCSAGNASVKGTVDGTGTADTHHGGIAGYMFVAGAKIVDCKNYATVTGTANRWTSHGGIVGSANNSLIQGCDNYGAIAGSIAGTLDQRYAFHGGIAGVIAGLIIDCKNEAGSSISATFASVTNYAAAYYGGIAGYIHNGSYGKTNDTSLVITGYTFTYSGLTYISGIINSTSNVTVTQCAAAITRRNVGSIVGFAEVSTYVANSNSGIIIAGCGTASAAAYSYSYNTSGVFTQIASSVTVIQTSAYRFLGSIIDIDDATKGVDAIENHSFADYLYYLIPILAVVLFICKTRKITFKKEHQMRRNDKKN